MELRPKKIIDKLTRPGIIIRCLVLENKVCKEKEKGVIHSSLRKLTTT
jgi:hypothetical protein